MPIALRMPGPRLPDLPENLPVAALIGAKEEHGDIDGRHSGDYLRLTRLLQHGTGFQWVIAIFTTMTYRQRLIDRLDAPYPQATLLEIPPEADPPALIDRLSELGKTQGPIHVVGVEPWLRRVGEDALGALNRRREHLAAKLPTTVILWLESATVARFASAAPDLWAWRAAVLDFSEQPVQLEAIHLERVTLGRNERAQLQTRLTQIRDYLAQRNELSSADAQLLLESSEIEQQLGHLDAALVDAESARQTFQHLDHPLGVAQAQVRIADNLKARGEMDAAQHLLEQEVLPTLERLGDAHARAVAQSRIADILMARSEIDAALRLLEREILPVFEHLGDVRAQAVAHSKLASVLLQAGRYPEAEKHLRQALAQALVLADYRLASAIAGDLINLLRERGALDRALELAEEKAEYTRRAGLGPWTQMADEIRRLQILAAQGQSQSVLDRVNALRPQLESLPEQGEAEETITPWNVRETLLDTGHTAALQLEAWEAALALNAEVLRYQEARGADGLALARTRFNDYAPLLRLGRRAECRRLLEDCQRAFAAAHDFLGLGKVYSAVADLEDKEGHPERAADFERGALKYRYQSGQPEECAICHHNLANYLKRSGAPADAVLAQRLADAVICYQIGSGGLQTSLRNLARNDLPPQPPRFAQVVASVEQLEGVRFGALFAALPPRAPDGDAAIAAVWERALAKRQEFLTQWAPLLQLIAAVALGHEEPRPALEELLPQLEADGWQLTAPVHALWSGERDAERLTAGIDPNSAQLIRHILSLLAAGEASP